MKTLPDAVVSRLPALRGNPLAKLASSFAVVRGNPIKNPGAFEFEVDNWVISEFIVKKILPFVGFHPFPLNELHLMVAATCRFRPSHIFEWGTHTGKSARVFYETTRHWGMENQDTFDRLAQRGASCGASRRQTRGLGEKQASRSSTFG